MNLQSPGMDTTTILIIVLAAVLLVLLVLFRGIFFSSEPREIQPVPETESGEKRIPCILCGSLLKRGENLKSEEFKGEKESIVHIYGCRNCYGETARTPRQCPVCKNFILSGGFLIGRMWITRKGKRHLHVSGCTACSRLYRNMTTSS